MMPAGGDNPDDHWNRLPDELKWKALGYLTPEELAQTMAPDRQWAAVGGELGEEHVRQWAAGFTDIAQRISAIGSAMQLDGMEEEFGGEDGIEAQLKRLSDHLADYVAQAIAAFGCDTAAWAGAPALRPLYDAWAEAEQALQFVRETI